MEFPFVNIGMSAWFALLKKVVNGDFAPLTQFLPLGNKKRVVKKLKGKKSKTQVKGVKKKLPVKKKVSNGKKKIKKLNQNVPTLPHNLV